MQAEREVGPRPTPLLGSVGGWFWGFQARQEQSIETKRAGLLLAAWGCLVYGVHKAHRYWESGETVDHKGSW